MDKDNFFFGMVLPPEPPKGFVWELQDDQSWKLIKDHEEEL